MGMSNLNRERVDRQTIWKQTELNSGSKTTQRLREKQVDAPMGELQTPQSPFAFVI